MRSNDPLASSPTHQLLPASIKTFNEARIIKAIVSFRCTVSIKHVSLAYPPFFLTWISYSKLTSELTMAQKANREKVVRNVILLKQLIKAYPPLRLRHRTELQSIHKIKSQKHGKRLERL